MDELERIINSTKPVFPKHHITKAILFGSRARGDATKDSDYDFCCDIEHHNCHFGLIALAALCNELDEVLHGESHVVDSFMLDQTNPGLYKNIESEGIVIYERGK